MDWLQVINLSFLPLSQENVLLNLIQQADILGPSFLFESDPDLVPKVCRMLRNVDIKNLEEVETRKIQLEILKVAICHADHCRKYVEIIMDALNLIINQDVEENVLLALHCLVDFHKFHRSHCENYVSSFIDFVASLYETALSPSYPKMVAESVGLTPQQRVGSCSLKVVVECPVMIVLLLQLYRKNTMEHISRMMPLIIDVLKMNIPWNVNLLITDVIDPIRPSCLDFIGVQVKTLSFFAYVAKSFPQLVKQYQREIPAAIIRILASCPPDCPSFRKEVLVATRHILSTDARLDFVPHLNSFCDIGLLLGEGYTAFYVFRPLALSMVADLVHHVRNDIQGDILERVFLLFVNSLHDSSLPIGIHVMCVKLLLNLVEPLVSRASSDEAGNFSSLLTFLVVRSYLSRLFETFGLKIERLAFVSQNVDVNSPSDLKDRINSLYYDNFIDDPLNSRPIQTDVVFSESGAEALRDFKFLFKTLLAAIKTVIFGFKSLHRSENGSFLQGCGLSLHELEIMSALFKNGLSCFDLFSTKDIVQLNSLPAEEKELVDHFSYLFVLLEPAAFQDVISAHVDFLVSKSLTNYLIVAVPQYFLATSLTSRGFAGLLLNSLMGRLEELGNDDANKSNVTLRLFKLVFLAVSIFPEENEAVLQPAIANIILACFNNHGRFAKGINYFLLLRSLFRSIGGGKFDALYKEVLPLLPVILEELGRLIQRTDEQHLKELYVELCLTTPVRLSVLLPYIGYLMPPLVVALNSGHDLVAQGLRTLELCVDNLTSEFLEAILADYASSIYKALWGLLKPLPFSQALSHSAIRILGKLGGRSRMLRMDGTTGPNNEPICPSCVIDFPVDIQGSTVLSLPVEVLIRMASWNCLFFESPERQDLVLTSIEVMASSLTRFIDAVQRMKPVPDVESLNRFIGESLTSLFHAASDKRFFPVVELILISTFADFASQPQSDSIDSSLIIVRSALMKAMVSAITSSVEAVSSLAISISRKVFERVKNSDGSEEDVPFLSLLLETLISTCYSNVVTKRLQLLKAMEEILNFEFPSVLLWKHDVRVVRAVLFVMKGMSGPSSSKPGELAIRVLLKILRKVSSGQESKAEDKHSQFLQRCNQLVTLLVGELSNGSQLVRSSVQVSLRVLADSTGSEVSELLLPLKDRLLSPIFTKPLRALPVSLQVGYIDAITYCLSLRPPLLEINDDFVRLAKECIAVLDAEDQSLIAKGSTFQSHATLSSLRSVCIRLLAAALTSGDVNNQLLSPLRHLISAVFFKALYSKSDEVVESARKAIEQSLVSQSRIPKELLQNGLKPVLVNLAEAQKISLSFVEGLARILQLLTNYFRPEIGNKLIEHLARWTDGNVLSQAKDRFLLESADIKTIVAILNVFPLLPPSGSAFIENLVKCVLECEAFTQRHLSSPFRAALSGFLSQNSGDAYEFFMRNLKRQGIGAILVSCLSASNARPLRKSFSDRLSGIIPMIWDEDLSHRLLILRIIAAIAADFAVELPDIKPLVPELWKLLASVDARSLYYISIARTIISITKYLVMRHPDSADIGFFLLQVFHMPIRVDFEDIARFLRDTWLPNAGTSALRDAIYFWGEVMSRKDVLNISKSRATRLLALPCLAILKSKHASEVASVVDAPFLHKLAGSLWERDCRFCINGSCIVAIEELQFTFLLCQTIDQKTALAWREKINWFCSNRITSLDPTVRLTSIIVTSRLEPILGLDSSFYNHSFNELKSSIISETRSIALKGLDQFIEQVSADASLMSNWTQTMAKALLKENNISYLVILWSILCRLPSVPDDLLLKCVSGFVHTGFQALSFGDSRTVCLAMIGKMLLWVDKSQLNLRARSSAIALLLNCMLRQLGSDPSGDLVKDDAFLALLGRIILDAAFEPSLVKLGSLDRILMADSSVDDNRGQICKVLDFALDILRLRNPEGFIQEFGPLLRYLKNLFATANGKRGMCEALSGYLHQLLTMLEVKLSGYDAKAACLIFRNLVTELQSSLEDDRSFYFCCTLFTFIAQAFAKFDLHQSDLEQVCSQLSQKISDFLVNLPRSAFQEGPEIGRLASRVSTYVEAMDQFKHQPWFPAAIHLGLIRHLWSYTNAKELDLVVLKTVSKWIREAKDLPSLPESCSIILMDSPCKNSSDAEVSNLFFEMILFIYDSRAPAFSEILSKLEGGFLRGFTTSSATFRVQFARLLDTNLPKSFFSRLVGLLSLNWNLVGNLNWFTSALSLIIDSPSSHAIKMLLLHSGTSDAVNQLSTSFFSQCWPHFTESMRCACSSLIERIIIQCPPGCTLALSTILSALISLEPVPRIDPVVLYYIAEYFGLWHPSTLLLEKYSLESLQNGSRPDLIGDSLISVYRLMHEDDPLNGFISRWSKLDETLLITSFMQGHRWRIAQRGAEKALEKVKIGSLPFSEFDCTQWEDIWLTASSKLQEWDIVHDVAKFCGRDDAVLDSIWRTSDWTQPETLKLVSSIRKSPATFGLRSAIFDTYVALEGLKSNPDSAADVSSTIEAGIQTCLRGWDSIPKMHSGAHQVFLHHFQMFVEMYEASSLYSNLGTGGPSLVRPQFLSELKGVLLSWRERLPSKWDDVDLWSDTLAWRQHVFSSLNQSFMGPDSIVNPATGGPGTGSVNSHPFAYRGYHELAWLINRFSQIARKNGMYDVCLSFLNRIYSLPNIEIHDAYMKLVEQSKCYLNTPEDLPTALEVINATNLNYFSNVQKAEFFALKGLTLSRLGMFEEANRIFAQSVQIDLNVGKGWSYWGAFNDFRFQQSHELPFAINAINCFLQAATLFKVARSRRFLSRILWLLTFEDEQGSLGKSFEIYNNELPVSFWLFFVPQLLVGLSRNEQKHCKFLLFKICKSFPQALLLPLRSALEDFKSSATGSSQDISTGGSEDASSPIAAIDELQATLKTAYPLLVLTVENMAEHMIHRLRSSPEEDLYRVLVTLLSEAYQQLMYKMNAPAGGDSSANAATPKFHGLESSIKRVSVMLGSNAALVEIYKEEFDSDFLGPDLDLSALISRLRRWRSSLYHNISHASNQPDSNNLELVSRYLSEFEYQKYEDVDVPGQYCTLRDNFNDFARIDRFSRNVSIIRRRGVSSRKIAIISTHGKRFTFLIQNPSGRMAKREEKINQLLKLMDQGLHRFISSQQRYLQLETGTFISISSQVRLVAEDSNWMTFEEILGQESEEPEFYSDHLITTHQRLFEEEVHRLETAFKRTNLDVVNVRTDIYQLLLTKIVGTGRLLRYNLRRSADPSLFWQGRFNFARSYATFIVSTYVLALGHRQAHKVGINGNEAMILTETLPSINSNGQITILEPVPFRFGPNVQEYLGPLGIDGALIPAIQAASEALGRANSPLADYLSLIVRDELVQWLLGSGSQVKRPRSNDFNELSAIRESGIDDRQFVGRVSQNCDLIMKRAQTLACFKEEESGNGSFYQTITDVLSSATSVQKLALMDSQWHPWF